MPRTQVLQQAHEDRDLVRSTGPDPRPARAGKRGDIQALRAAAVGLVVLYHFWPHHLPGGFVGVDVFFAISGFLIISHLLDEHRRTGSISLPRFWARRARRLLPASLLVLAVSAVGAVTLLPGSQQLQALREIIASTLYVQNWALAADSVDYLAAENLPSPVQHFWSLSTEEQFYVAVPLLMVVGALLRGRAAMLAILTVTTGASLAYSIYLTDAAPGPAYFVTPTRAWEFAAGGLLAFAPSTLRWARARTVTAWAGWTAIAVTGLTYSSETPFPGYTAALPVLGTLAVIWAAGPRGRFAPDRLLVNPVSVYLGDVSYSVYLWHWPVLVFAGAQLGSAFTWPVKLVALCGVVALARLTWRYVENPVQRHRVLVSRPNRFTFVAAVAAMAVIVAPLTLASVQLRQAAAAGMAAAEAAAEAHAECFGAASLSGDCAGMVFDELTPDPSVAGADKGEIYKDDCQSELAEPGMPTCQYGDPNGEFRVAIVGDSHVTAWAPAVIRLAEEHHWSLTTYLKSSCAHSTALKLRKNAAIQESCRTWNETLSAEAQRGDTYDLVVVTHSVNGQTYGSAEVAVRGYREAWRMFTDRGAQVVVIRDNPRMTAETGACLEENEQDPSVCDVPERSALQETDLMVAAAQGQPGVHVADLTDTFCWDGTCKAAIGGVVVYRDPHHLTRTFAVTLAPALEAELRSSGLL